MPECKTCVGCPQRENEWPECELRLKLADAYEKLAAAKKDRCSGNVEGMCRGAERIAKLEAAINERYHRIAELEAATMVATKETEVLRKRNMELDGRLAAAELRYTHEGFNACEKLKVRPLEARIAELNAQLAAAPKILVEVVIK